VAIETFYLKQFILNVLLNSIPDILPTVKDFSLTYRIELVETFAKMLGVSDLTKSGVGGGEVVGEMEPAEGVALQF
jgi:hypothetical protein